MRNLSRWLVVCLASLAVLSMGARFDCDFDDDDDSCLFLCGLDD